MLCEQPDGTTAGVLPNVVFVVAVGASVPVSR